MLKYFCHQLGAMKLFYNFQPVAYHLFNKVKQFLLFSIGYEIFQFADSLKVAEVLMVLKWILGQL